ncbi:ribosomal protein L28e [Cubamyces sp. BRFM 1775]|nr:ribosomal protein L28e [Cubamyces lactineus]KAI0327651.1 ribosomal protein L28e [Cubamyces sp. BRFM 1775]
MSGDLQWLLLRKSNSFTVKRVPEGPVFSKEPGNLTNIHSWKYSGLANEKTIAVQDTESGIKIAYRKKGASPHAVRSSYSTLVVRPRSGGRRAAGVTAQLAKRGYRPDLRAAALARVSALIAAKREKKAAPPKKVRGKKAKTA